MTSVIFSRLGRSTFIRTIIIIVCDDVAVTYVSLNTAEYSIATVYIIQAQKARVNKYILHGVSDVDLKNISLSSNQRVSTYTLSANKNFSIFFEVFTAGGPVNVSHDTFSKTINECVYIY